METPITPEYQNLNQNTSPIVPQNNNYKILFLIFLGLFLIVSSVLATLLFTQKKPEISKITEIEEQKIVPTKTTISEITDTPTSNSIPKDWKTYTDPTYKFSISYPSEWTLEKGAYSLNKIDNDVDTIVDPDWFTIKSPEGEKEEKRIKSEPPTGEGYISPCGFYYLNCYKSYDLFKTKTRVKENTLLSYLKSFDVGGYTQSTIDGHILYSTNPNWLNAGKTFYIQNKDTSFCYLQFCWQTSSEKELTSTEKQFVNSFKFN